MSSARPRSSNSGQRTAASTSTTTSTASQQRRSKSPDILQHEQPGLRRIVQQRLLKDVFESTSEKDPGWKILIVDEHSMRVISSAVGMYDIMERKVTLVESLEKKRAPFPDMAAIYVLEPSTKSVRTLISDFNTKPLYGKSIFLFFLGRLSDALLNEIKACTQLVRRVKSLLEVNIDFLAREERAFTFELPSETFASIYLRQSNTPVEVEIAQKLVTVCGSMNEYPHIRYKNDSAVCTSLASVFKLKMDEFVSQNPKWWYHGGPNKTQSAAMKERGTLLLLDRAEDLLSPLMHDFTYQAMVHDLIPMEGDRVTVASDDVESSKDATKDVLLDEKDGIWVELRGKHIAAVIEILSTRIRDIMNSGTGSALAGSSNAGTLSLSQMAAALKALPEYQEVLSKLSQHMHLSHQCMDEFGSQQLLALAEIEQTLATGKDDDNKSPKVADIMEQVESELTKMKNIKDKIRLILICIISCNGLRTQDKRRLYAAAELSAKDTRVLQESLDVLGLPVYNDNDKNRPITGLPSRLAPDEDSQYAATRYVPVLKSTLMALSDNELSFDIFPSLLPMPVSASIPVGRNSTATGSGARNSTVASVRKSASGAASSARKSGGPSSKWAANSSSLSASGSSTGNSGPIAFTGARHLVFMVGGLCYSEIRVAREVMEATSREIIVGSTSFVSANEFLDDLGKLSR